MSQPLLDVDNLSTIFAVRRGGMFSGWADLRAVNEVSLTLKEGETLGIVGESGCGKSTLGRSILRLIEPSDGRVTWRGEDLTALKPEEMRQRRRDMQIIFQDPIASLDPRMTVGQIIAEPLTVFEKELARDERTRRVAEIMQAVGLTPEMVQRYPHEFSGGQAQRIGIARAIVTRPKLVVCDEPVSALDVSIQAQIIRLLLDLKERFGLTLIFISHDLSVIRLLCDRVMVLYLGRVVEVAPKEQLFAAPAHPYTRALLSAAPVPDPKLARTRKRVIARGDPPSPLNPPSGCAFRTRCPMARDICAAERPALLETEPGHRAACHFAGEVQELD